MVLPLSAAESKKATIELRQFQLRNTVDGMGRDIERGGEKIQDGSRNVKERM